MGTQVEIDAYNAGDVLVGYGHKAWWLNAGQDAAMAESTHYAGAIPSADIARRLFGWSAEPVALINGRTFDVVEGHVLNVRSDNGAGLGIVSDNYAVHQYRESLLDGTANIIGDGLGYASAGLLKSGARAFVTVATGDLVSESGVEFLPYLTAYGSHDGSWSTGYKASVILTVCSNTAALMIGENNGPGAANVKVRHTRLSVPRLASAQDALSVIYRTADAFSAQVRALCEQTVTPAQWDAVLDEIAPPAAKDATPRARTMADNKRDALNAMAKNDPRAAPWFGTAFGAVQAVSTYVQHVQTVRGATRAERNMMAGIDGTFDKLDAATLLTVSRVLANA